MKLIWIFGIICAATGAAIAIASQNYSAAIWAATSSYCAFVIGRLDPPRKRISKLSIESVGKHRSSISNIS